MTAARGVARGAARVPSALSAGASICLTNVVERALPPSDVQMNGVIHWTGHLVVKPRTVRTGLNYVMSATWVCVNDVNELAPRFSKV